MQNCNFGTQFIVQIDLLQFIQARVFYRKFRHTKLHAAIEWRIEREQSLFRSKIGEERAQTRSQRVDQRRALKPRQETRVEQLRKTSNACAVRPSWFCALPRRF